MSAGLRVWGVPLPGEVAAGADLAALVAAAEPGLADGDVVVVTSKVVSKAEGRVLPCPPDPAGREAARQAAIDAETVRVVARREPTRIVETRHGFVLAAAGVDASNTAPDTLVLLPDDADVSARRLRDGLHRLLGVRVAVVVSDTAGRPWRRGLVDVAVGAAGIAPLRDYRGRADAYGNPLALTEMADVDALAAAAELVKGKLAGVPVAVVRGLDYAPSDDGVRALVRPAAEDLFRLGTAEAVAAGRGELAAALRAAVDEPEGPGWPTVPDAGITTYRCDDGSLLVGVAADRLAADPALATHAGVVATLACADLVAAGRRVRLQLRGPFPPAPAAVGVVVARVLMAPEGPA